MRPICLSLFAILFVGCQETRNDSPAVPLSDVSGMINGSPFQPDSVTLKEQTLSFRQGKEFFADIDLKVKRPENTHLVGKFSATQKKTGKEPLDAEDAPFVQGKIVMMGDWEEESLGVGFTGKGTDGKSYSNGCGTEVKRAIFRNNEANVEVIAGSESAVTLVRNE